MLQAAQLGVLSYRGEPQSRESMVHDTASSYVNELFDHVRAALEHEGVMEPMADNELLAAPGGQAHKLADTID